MKKRIALIYGGEGCEQDISTASAENLAEMIDNELYTVICVLIDKDGGWYICDKPRGKRLSATYPVMLNGVSGLLCRGEIIPIDAAIPALHGDFGEDGVISGALTASHIKYIGQDCHAAAFTSDKLMTKLACRELSIPTAKWICGADKETAEKELGYPMFIKPRRLGSSIGAAPVASREDFDAAYREAKKHSNLLMTEKYIDFAYEVECAYLETDEKHFSPTGRILSSEFYDFEAKYGEDVIKTDTAAGFDPEVEERICEYSRLLVDFFGLRHLSRLDFFVTREKEVIFNEINNFPGMTKTSLYPKLTENMGCRRGEFINILTEGVIRDRSL